MGSPNRVATFGALVLLAATVQAQAAGPYQVAESSYKFPGRDEPLVATDRKVDLWAEVYRPAALAGKALPVAVFLHGNHGTCGYFDQDAGVRIDNDATYTDAGTCPDGYTVTPNHLGYTYLAQELASWGYMVVSINANRGITAGGGIAGDGGLNLMRGRLVLRHLALLSDWNAGKGAIAPPPSLGFDPRHTMDFSQVGLMGHSRGGEGMRAALQQYRDAGSSFPALVPGLNIRSIFEIGPVDGQTYRTLDADGVNSMVLLPSCDGDVSNLAGMRVFDRVFLRKTVDPVQSFHGTVYAYGTDHNAYNTEWLISDTNTCLGTPALFPEEGRSTQQQAVALATLVPFFRATVGTGANKTLASFFDPTSPLPPALAKVTKVDRGYLPVPPGADTVLLETFSQSTGTGNTGAPTSAEGVTVVNQGASWEHAPGTTVATVSWTPDSPSGRYFQVNLAGERDVSAFKALSFRTALRCFGTICDNPYAAMGEMTYGVQLLDAGGRSSNVFTTDTEVRLSRPVGYDAGGDSGVHAILGTTISVPTGAVRGVDLAHVKAVRFTFGTRTQGIVDLADIALLKSAPAPTAPMSVDVASATAPAVATASVKATRLGSPTAAQDGNALKVVRTAAKAGSFGVSKVAVPSSVDVVLTTNRRFPFTDTFPRLKVGDTVVQGATSLSANAKTMTITVPQATYDTMPSGVPVSLQVLASQPAWQFGPLPK